MGKFSTECSRTDLKLWLGHTKTALDTRPRRLARADVGEAIWSTIERPTVVSSMAADEGESGDCISSQPLPNVSTISSDEHDDDPFGHGFAIM